MQAVSIIIPTWNEEGSITKLVERIHTSLLNNNILYEIIFVDDHSTDKTRALITKLSLIYPITFLTKQGKKGKAQSLIEGFSQAQYATLCMIDADLQYPPEAISKMMEKITKGADIVVANRREYHSSEFRRFLSVSFKKIFGNYLFGLNHDVQSGLKLFKKIVFETVRVHPRSGWTFDLEFLYKASFAGFSIVNHDISFEERKNGKSKISFLKTSLEIGMDALLLRTKKLMPQHIPAGDTNSMHGAGIGFKRKKYITHTTLHHSQSAIITFVAKQKLLLAMLCILFVEGLVLNTLLTVQVFIAVLSAIYFLDVLFNFWIILKSLHVSQEIASTVQEIRKLQNKDLPVYSILCPLYKEAHVIPQFLDAITKLDWPKTKLDVMLLLEADDKRTIKAVEEMKLPSYVQTIIVPHSLPKTKPKACNYGLHHAKGEYLVIYDAEDMPDPLQLKKAFLGFKKADPNTICLQAKLNYYNPHQNLLTRFFTAEYSLWFDVTLTGLQSLNSIIPLGGTSNHFKTNDLKKLQGWDAFNVTEDADLGIRLFKRGYKTAIIDSVTLEEANSNFKNWLRQRSRWIKGYMQTYLIHTRDLFGFKNTEKKHSLIFHLVVGGKIAFILINPFLWIATITYFTLYAIVGPTIEALYPPLVFYMAGTSLVFGNFLFLYYYMLGLAKREQWDLVKYVYFVPFYWLAISIAGGIALYQLIFKPHYWEKTIHGLHLNKNTRQVLSEAVIETQEQPIGIRFPKAFRARLATLLTNKKTIIGGAALVSASIIANFLNFFFNAYLGRVLTFSDFALISLVGGFLSFSSILFGAYSTTVNYRSSFLIGRYGRESAYDFWRYIRRNGIYASIVITILWLVLTPFMDKFFDTDNVKVFFVFAIVLLVGLANAADRGFLSSKFMFGSIAAINLGDPLIKFFTVIFLVGLGLQRGAYIAVPLAIFGTFIIGWLLVVKHNKKEIHHVEPHEVKHFPKKFFAASMISGLSLVSFMSMDILLAKHYLHSVEAGQYALLTLVGKMVYFMAGLTTPFIVPIIGRNEGENKNSLRSLKYIILFTFILGLIGFIAFGVFGWFTIPFLYGSKAFVIVPYLLFYAFGMFCFSISKVLSNYYLIKKMYTFTIVGVLLSLIQIIVIVLNHQSVKDIALDMTFVWTLHLIVNGFLHLNFKYIKTLESNVADFFELFIRNKEYTIQGNVRILIFNWRDTKHKWAGGAETYVHELAKQWVKEGNSVTIFAGNDHKHARNDVIDGVHIIRRGGFYTVYFWAFIYYIFKLRNSFDVIIDSENGIPFFTPFYARKPIFLLIHHIHQEVFREHLAFPLSVIAQLIESKFMPFFYKKSNIITVSESSKKTIIKLGLGTEESISVIHPGISFYEFQEIAKTKHPSLLYLGRLKPYKNVDVAIKAFAKVIKKFPDATFTIAGFGESRSSLEKLATSLNLQKNIHFAGTISEENKKRLLSESWVMVQPSMIEGWGITVIEANASGTPVVASNVNGLKDSVVHNQTGILVNPKNSNEFAHAIISLFLDENARVQISQQAIEWATKFSWKESANKFYTLIINEASKQKIMSTVYAAQKHYEHN